MKAHYYIDKDTLSGNGIKYLFIPEKKVVISLGPIHGELIIKDLMHGHFLTQNKTIDYAQKTVEEKGDKSSHFMHVEYKGEITLPKEYAEEIDNMLKKYESLRIITASINEESDTKRKKLEQLAKEQFPD